MATNAVTTLGASVSIAASTTSANAALVAEGNDIYRIVNGTNGIAYLVFGQGAQTATLTSPVIVPPSSYCDYYVIGNVNNVACILNTGATSGTVALTPCASG